MKRAVILSSSSEISAADDVSAKMSVWNRLEQIKCGVVTVRATLPSRGIVVGCCRCSSGDGGTEACGSFSETYKKSNNKHLSTRKVKEDAIWTFLPTSKRELTAREGPLLQTRFQELEQKKIDKCQNKIVHLLLTEQTELTPSLMTLLWLKLKRNSAWDDFCHDVLLERGQCAWSRGDPEAFYYLNVLLHLKNAFRLSKSAELKVQRPLIKMG